MACRIRHEREKTDEIHKALSVWSKITSAVTSYDKLNELAGGWSRAVAQWDCSRRRHELHCQPIISAASRPAAAASPLNTSARSRSGRKGLLAFMTMGHHEGSQRRPDDQRHFLTAVVRKQRPHHLSAVPLNNEVCFRPASLTQPLFVVFSAVLVQTLSPQNHMRKGLLHCCYRIG